jgi:hypothetical protein
MSSLVNMLIGGAIAVAVVLAFWLLIGFIDDMQQHHARR